MIDRSLFSLPGIKKVLGILCVFAALQAGLIIGQAWSLSSAITNLWYGGVVVDQTLWLAVFLVCFIVRQLVAYAQDHYLELYAYERADTLRQDALAKLFAEGSAVVQTHGTGKVTTMVLEGVDQVESYLRLILPKITRLLIIPLILLILVFILDWVSGLILCIIFPFIILYMVILGYNAKDKAAKQYGEFQILSNHFIDSLRGLDTLKLFGRSKQHGSTIFATSERFREATMKTLRVATLSGFILDLFATLSIAAVAIMLGVRLVEGSMLLFPALTVLVLSPEYFRPIREFAADYHASLDGKNALAAIVSLIAEPTTEVGTHPMPLWQSNSMLRINDLKFSYPDHVALQDLSFTVEGAAKVGVIGASGSGKSTLIDILGGFYTPDQGSITADEVTVPNLKQHDWQKQVIYIPQDPYIFHASLRENITFYHPAATDENVAQAVEVVGLQDLIDELPDGLDTKIGEGARGLSGGQAQRIALARAFLDKSRKVLLFDEPTAHLDIETEMELKERMLPLMRDRLVFFATHRLHWMRDMDTILVLDEGRLVEAGPPDDLLAQQGSLGRITSLIGGDSDETF